MNPLQPLMVPVLHLVLMRLQLSTSATLFVGPLIPDPRLTTLYRAPAVYRAHHRGSQLGPGLIIVSKHSTQPLLGIRNSGRLVLTGGAPSKKPSIGTTEIGFRGEWKLVTPSMDTENTSWTDGNVVYNADGTRVLPERLTDHRRVGPPMTNANHTINNLDDLRVQQPESSPNPNIEPVSGNDNITSVPLMVISVTPGEEILGPNSTREDDSTSATTSRATDPEFDDKGNDYDYPDHDYIQAPPRRGPLRLKKPTRITTSKPESLLSKLGHGLISSLIGKIFNGRDTDEVKNGPKGPLHRVGAHEQDEQFGGVSDTNLPMQPNGYNVKVNTLPYIPGYGPQSTVIPFGENTWWSGGAQTQTGVPAEQQRPQKPEEDSNNNEAHVQQYDYDTQNDGAYNDSNQPWWINPQPSMEGWQPIKVPHPNTHDSTMLWPNQNQHGVYPSNVPSHFYLPAPLRPNPMSISISAPSQVDNSTRFNVANTQSNLEPPPTDDQWLTIINPKLESESEVNPLSSLRPQETEFDLPVATSGGFALGTHVPMGTSSDTHIGVLLNKTNFGGDEVEDTDTSELDLEKPLKDDRRHLTHLSLHNESSSEFNERDFNNTFSNVWKGIINRTDVDTLKSQGWENNSISISEITQNDISLSNMSEPVLNMSRWNNNNITDNIKHTVNDKAVSEPQSYNRTHEDTFSEFVDFYHNLENKVPQLFPSIGHIYPKLTEFNRHHFNNSQMDVKNGLTHLDP